MLNASGIANEKITLFTERFSYGEFSKSPSNLQEVFMHFGNEVSSGQFVEVLKEATKITKVNFFGEEKACQHEFSMDLLALMNAAGITGSICPYCGCPSDERINIGSEKHQTAIDEDTTGFIKSPRCRFHIEVVHMCLRTTEHVILSFVNLMEVWKVDYSKINQYVKDN